MAHSAEIVGVTAPMVIVPSAPGSARDTRPANQVVALPVVVWAVGLVAVGGVLESYANGSFSAWFIALFFLVCGAAVVGVVGRLRRAELRAFALTYGGCVFAGGLAQCYSLAVWNQTQDFSDAIFFYSQLPLRPPFRVFSLADEAPLALTLWQSAYRAAWALGLSPGLSLGMSVNALVMGFAAAVTVATARRLFGDDSWHLRRVGTLFASCGLFLLFGSLLLRDCFIVLIHTIWLWAAVRWVVRPSTATLLMTILVSVAAPLVLPLLRPEMVPMFFGYGFLVVLCWFVTRRLNVARLAFVALAVVAILFAAPYVPGFTEMLREARAVGSEKYQVVSVQESSQTSLGMQFVMNQPLPIRLVTGNAVLMLGPIPVWASFSFSQYSYHWLRGFQTLYQLFVVPLAVTGLVVVARLVRTRGRKAMPWLFVVAYLLVSDVAVVATSLEARHLGPAMTALTILAALPDTREQWQRRQHRVIALTWFAMFGGVYLAWMLLKWLA